jgi:hypothetical protein
MYGVDWVNASAFANNTVARRSAWSASIRRVFPIPGSPAISISQPWPVVA